MTDQHLYLYQGVWGEAVQPESRGDIIEELRRILAAKTQQEAIDVISWWYDPLVPPSRRDNQALGDINEFRRLAGVEPLLSEDERYVKRLENLVIMIDEELVGHEISEDSSEELAVMSGMIRYRRNMV